MRDDGSGTFELDGATLLELDADDAISSQAIGFTADDAALYVDHPRRGQRRRPRADRARRGRPRRSPTTRPTTSPPPSSTRSPATVEIVSFLRARLEHQVLDPALAPDIDAITALRPGDAFLISRDHADRTWTVGFTADDGPVAYYAFDRGERSGRFLFTQHDDLARYRLSADGAVRVHGPRRARDPRLPDVPARTRPRQGLPTVLYVHGGPWARDTWGYDPTAQWLANRGYLCVQVNYRGSTGYGKAFLNAGDREWGRRMHDDLIDAVEHVVGLGARRPLARRRSTAARTAAMRPWSARRSRPTSSGAPSTSSARRTCARCSRRSRRTGSSSPRSSIAGSATPRPTSTSCGSARRSRASADIRIPLLIAQGANDPRVKMSESDQIVEALRERGIPHTYLVYEDEGHGFKKPENAMAFQAEAERFLAEHLGGRCEP